MDKKVMKRSGDLVDFHLEKISIAIAGAFDELGKEFDDISVLDDIQDLIDQEKDDYISVEDIQDIVQTVLFEHKYYKEGAAYVRYRTEHELARRKKIDDEIKEKLMASNVQNQNANVDEYSFGGRKGETDSVVMKQFALDNLISKKFADNHINNRVYIHDLDSYAVGMHNCTVRETKFITPQCGVISFEDLEDGDLIRVFDHQGNIKVATVHNYGKQLVNKITFSLAGQRFVTERFTANHRWILADGTITDNLQVGDKLVKAPIHLRNFSWENATDEEQYYWCLGFVLADGTEAYRWSHGKKNEDVKFVRMRLCGDKIKYEPRFAALKHSTKEMDNGDLYLTFSSIIDFHKTFPDVAHMSWSEKQAFFEGFYAADGQHAGSRKSILTTDPQMASFIEDEAPALGYFILKIQDKTGEKTNYKTRGFTKEYTFIGDNNKYYWTVVNIEPDTIEDVWCLSVPDTHSFVLPNGITTGNCLTIPFDDLLAKGFNTRQTDVRPANSVNTAMQLVAVIFQLQSLCQFGGVSASHLDWTMVPYVRKSFYKHFKDGLFYCSDVTWDWVKDDFNDSMSIDDKEYKNYQFAYEYALDMTERETHQAVEGMYHNLNTLQSRSGNQLPFTSINYGTCTLPEGRMVTKAILEVSIEGLGRLHKTSIFPCGIFQCMKNVNRKPGDPNYDLFKLALQSTAKRLYPNYANIDWSINVGYDINDPETYVSSMGCRTYNGADINVDPGVNPQLKDGRGNCAPATIILPTLAMEARGDTVTFFQLLEEALEDARDELIERYEWICSQNPKSAQFMYENGTMRGFNGKNIRSAMKHCTLAIGQIGLAETLQILIGKDQTTEEGMELAKRIEGFINTRCKWYKEEYKLNFGVYYTPAENLCYTAMKKFQQKYGIIKNVSDKEYFTNSIHIPVYHQLSAFEKIDLEAELTGYSNAGCITYVELDGTVNNNIEGLEELVNYAMDKDIPYLALNIPNDTCLNCGYTGEFDNECPQCHSHNIQQLRRVTGYLTGDYKTAFN